MRFSSQESISAIEKAQHREKEAVELYERCLSETENESLKIVLHLLVTEEQKHHRILSEMINEARKDNIPVISIETGKSAKDMLDSAFAHISMEGFSAEKASIDELLVQALENEKESFTLYSTLADSSDNNETKAVFQYLATEENKHYVMVSNLLNFLGDPGRWVYEEENLIFRRG